MNPEEILQHYWKYSYFRSGQLEIIQKVISGDDVLGLLPTGGGKSICYQVPGIYFGGITIVVSPLIALIKDQVEALMSRGIKAKAIYSGMHRSEIEAALDTCLYDPSVRFLFISPERIQTEVFQGRVREMNVSLLVIDEAHCISQWGYDFRPAYLSINELKEIIPNKVPILALTASATPKVQSDIQEKLAFRSDHKFIYKGAFSRPNLSLNIRQVENKQSKLLEVLQAIKGSSIVYVSSRKVAEQLSKMLGASDISAVYYHAGLSADDRSKRQQWWIENRVRVMVATNAFGMGIDKPDVRLVVHYQLPNALEAYYQEAGRAGRDGNKAFALVLYEKYDIDRLWEMNAMSFPELSVVDRVYNALCNFNKLALGVRLSGSVDFDINEISSVYKIPIGELHYAIKRLEQLSLIATNDAFKNPSRVKVYYNREELYRFQVGNKAAAPVLKSLLRNYGANIFDDYLKINEQLIANDIKEQRSEVEKTLLHLTNLKIINYQATNFKPQLVFTSPRVTSSDLRKHFFVIEDLKKEQVIGLKTFVTYLQTKSCRSKYIADYFGVTSERCGVCDNCKSEATSKLSEEAVLGTIKLQESVSLEALHQQYVDYSIEQLKEVLRNLYDRNLIHYEGGKIIAT